MKESRGRKSFDANLYLVGFMATGKSTLGRALAKRLGFDFLDSDAEIERMCGKPIATLFEEEGEEVFRKYERDFILSGHPSRRCVVACGGGLVAQPGMSDLLKEKGVVVCLYASPETVLARTRNDRKRPLLKAENPEARIRDLMLSREPFYREAGITVLTDNRAPRDVLEHVRRIYVQQAKRFVRDEEKQ